MAVPMTSRRNRDILPGAWDCPHVTTREPWLMCEPCSQVTHHSYIGSQRQIRDLVIGHDDHPSKSGMRLTPVWGHQFMCACGTTRVWGIS